MRIPHTWFCGSIVALTLVAASAAYGQDRNQRFRERDRNGDDVLTVEEYGGHPGNFRSLDRNRDGVLSRDEFVNRGNRIPDDDSENLDAFGRMDLNKDAVIAKAEWTGDTNLYNRMDRDDDGRITREEYANPLPEGDRNAHFRDLDKDTNRTLSRAEWRGEVPGFDVMDQNNDGQISGEEYMTPNVGTPEAQFDRLDRNNDNFVSRWEWRGQTMGFDEADRNDDGRITLDELRTPAATGTAATGDARFRERDRNRDGVISRREWTGETVAFHAADRNNDGVVTLREYRTQPVGNPTEARFESMDEDGDNVIDRNEWPRAEATTFERADRNNDGVVTLREFLNQSSTEVADETFDEIDHNNDGVLSRSEWHSDLNTFQALDRNDDNVVTLWEYTNTPRAVAVELPADRFVDLDRDRNGYVTRAEWGGDAESFGILDSSRDSRISRYEFGLKQNLARRFDWLDSDNDGWLTTEEWSGNATTFRFFDRNRDGRISRVEFLN